MQKCLIASKYLSLASDKIIWFGCILNSCSCTCWGFPLSPVGCCCQAEERDRASPAVALSCTAHDKNTKRNWNNKDRWLRWPQLSDHSDVWVPPQKVFKTKATIVKLLTTKSDMLTVSDWACFCLFTCLVNSVQNSNQASLCFSEKVPFAPQLWHHKCFVVRSLVMSMAIIAMAPGGLIMPSSILMYTHLYAHAAL